MARGALNQIRKVCSFVPFEKNKEIKEKKEPTHSPQIPKHKKPKQTPDLKIDLTPPQKNEKKRKKAKPKNQIQSILFQSMK